MVQELILPTAQVVGRHEDAWMAIGRRGVPMLALCHLILELVISIPGSDPYLDEFDIGSYLTDYLIKHGSVYRDANPELMPLEELNALRLAAYELYRNLCTIRHVLVGAKDPSVCPSGIMLTRWLGKDMVVAVQTAQPGYSYNATGS